MSVFLGAWLFFFLYLRVKSLPCVLLLPSSLSSFYWLHLFASLLLSLFFLPSVGQEAKSITPEGSNPTAH